MKLHEVLAAAVLCALCVGCQHNSVERQTAALSMTASTVGQRQIQSRRFETRDEYFVLSACAGVLQDLGFTIDETAPDSGLLIASKDRDAVEAGQIAGQFFLVALAAALGAQHDPVWERNQKIRISVATRVVPGNVVVRATFQRVIWNTRDQISRVESIDDPNIYQEFFQKLSQSMFLEAHDV
jgi:hypothetical protein